MGVNIYFHKMKKLMSLRYWLYDDDEDDEQLDEIVMILDDDEDDERLSLKKYLLMKQCILLKFELDDQVAVFVEIVIDYDGLDVILVFEI